VFLDRRWVLFGALCNDPDQDTDRLYHPYLEIMDPTDPIHSTILELDDGAVKHASTDCMVDISLGSGMGHEESPPIGNGGMPFISDTSRGIISADVCCCNHDTGGPNDIPRYESRVFVLYIEDVLSKVPSPPNPEQHCVEWKDLSPSAGMFSYASMHDDRYRIFSRHSYVTAFRYASPIRPLDPEDSTGRRCFFVYDFNPHRETLDPLPGAALSTPDPATGYPKRADEIVREVVGGLSCWRMRFGLPAPAEDIDKCHVALTDGGVVLFEVRYRLKSFSEWFDSDAVSFEQLSASGEESLTVFSMW
jgi:hypothetical protein